MAPHAEDLVDDEPPAIEPYTVLGLEKSATEDDVKKAYRRAALKHHPDKASPSDKDAAHLKFQGIAFAYAILSDSKRRKRYDTTGSTAETLSASDDDFSWSDFFAAQFADVVSSDAIEVFARSYKGSDEEKDDVLRVYKEAEGKWDAIYEQVMLSNPLEDEDRYRAWIDEAIVKGEVEKYAAYAKETSKARAKRMRNAKDEAGEAEEYAKELGVHEKLFGKGKGGAKGKSKAAEGEDALAALIKQKQAKQNGSGSFLDRLQGKYATQEQQKKKSKGKGKKETKIADDGADDTSGMPSEEAFEAASKRLNDRKADTADDSGRKSKRVQR